MIDYKQYIAEKLNAPLEKAELAAYITETADDSFGDYSFPCFRLAKSMRMPPNAIAQKFAEEFAADNVVEKVQAVGGYLNFFVNRKALVSEILDDVLTKSGQYGNSDEGNGKTICIDYSSVNIAKSLHIGHLGTTAIGSSLHKLYTALGYKVVGINYLGDYGTQFGKMIVAYKLWGNKEKVDREGVKALQELYVRFHVEEEGNPQLTEQAREWFAKIENGDPEARELFQYFKKITLDDVMEIYQRLHVDFEDWRGESYYSDKMAGPLQVLRDKGLITESMGAQIVDLSAYDMPPCLLVKSDGSSLYATRDIAAAVCRAEEYKFDKCLYVVAYQQNLHFRQVFKVLDLAGYPWAKDLVHVAYGMVSLEDGAMSTRKGNTVFLRDVINKAVQKSLDIITVKNPDLPNKERVAEQVGCGAVLFSALENSKIKDITFTFDRVLNFDGETAPYLQYTHARCNSIIEKAANGTANYVLAREVDGDVDPYTCAVDEEAGFDMDALNNPEALRLAKLLGAFPAAVRDAAYKYEPSVVSVLLIDIAQAFNKFYTEHRVISENAKEQNARLKLVKATEIVLKKGLALLGIQAPEKM